MEAKAISNSFGAAPFESYGCNVKMQTKARLTLNELTFNKLTLNKLTLNKLTLNKLTLNL